LVLIGIPDIKIVPNNTLLKFDKDLNCEAFYYERKKAVYNNYPHHNYNNVGKSTGPTNTSIDRAAGGKKDEGGKGKKESKVRNGLLKLNSFLQYQDSKHLLMNGFYLIDRKVKSFTKIEEEDYEDTLMYIHSEYYENCSVVYFYNGIPLDEAVITAIELSEIKSIIDKLGFGIVLSGREENLLGRALLSPLTVIYNGIVSSLIWSTNQIFHQIYYGNEEIQTISTLLGGMLFFFQDKQLIKTLVSKK